MDVIHFKNIEVFQVQGTVLGIGIAIEYVFIVLIISKIFSYHFPLQFMFPFSTD